LTRQKSARWYLAAAPTVAELPSAYLSFHQAQTGTAVRGFRQWDQRDAFSFEGVEGGCGETTVYLYNLVVLREGRTYLYDDVELEGRRCGRDWG